MQFVAGKPSGMREFGPVRAPSARVVFGVSVFLAVEAVFYQDRGFRTGVNFLGYSFRRYAAFRRTCHNRSRPDVFAPRPAPWASACSLRHIQSTPYHFNINNANSKSCASFPTAIFEFVIHSVCFLTGFVTIRAICLILMAVRPANARFTRICGRRT